MNLYVMQIYNEESPNVCFSSRIYLDPGSQRKQLAVRAWPSIDRLGEIYLRDAPSNRLDAQELKRKCKVL